MALYLKHQQVIDQGTPNIPDSVPERFGNDPVLWENGGLHSDAHLSPEDWKKLGEINFVGDPVNEWMAGMVVRRGGNGDVVERSFAEHITIPSEFWKNYEFLNPYRSEIYYCLNLMTTLANVPGLEEDEEFRLLYQKAEMRIMYLVRKAIIEKLGDTDPSRNVVGIARNGAGIFLDMYGEIADGVIDVQLKRVWLRNGKFAVANEKIPPVESEKAEVGVLFLPDDCYSTGMTQDIFLQKILEAGYRPKKIVLAFTVATMDAIGNLYRKFSTLRAKYGFDIILLPGAICEAVNEAMYLLTLDGKRLLVGNMGAWNKAIPGIEFPQGDKPLIVNKGQQEG